MKRRISLLAALVLVLTLCPALSAASTKQEISGKSYNIEVRSIDQVTSLNGKYTALETFKTTERKKNVRKIRFAYDETEEKADITGRFTTDAKIALVRVDGFDSRLAAITDPEQVVVTVNGQPISVDSGASYSDNVGWQNVHSGSYGVVMIDGDNGVIKRVECAPDHITLHSVNPMYPPRVFKGSDMLRIRIFGEVKGLRRSF